MAVAVLGIGLGVILEGLGQGLRLRRQAEENLRLAIVAETLLDRVRSAKGVPIEAEEGEEEGLAWRIEPRGASEAADEGRPDTGLVEVRLSVEAPSGRIWEVVTLLPGKEDGVP